MKYRHTLLLDMDGPLADFDAYFWRQCVERGYQFDIDSLEDQRHRFLTDHMPHEYERAAARWQVDNTQWFKFLPVTPGAKEGVAELMEHFDVWVCSKPLEANMWCASDKFEWIDRHFPALNGRLILAPDKSMVHGSILLDDAPKREWLSHATWNPVLFSVPFNRQGYPGIPHWAWGRPVELLLDLAWAGVPYG